VKAAPVLKELGQSSEKIPEGLNDATPEERHRRSTRCSTSRSLDVVLTTLGSDRYGGWTQ
jgi:hypothetical protein